MRYSVTQLVVLAAFETTLFFTGYVWIFSDIDGVTPGKIDEADSVKEGKRVADEYVVSHGWYLL